MCSAGKACIPGLLSLAAEGAGMLCRLLPNERGPPVWVTGVPVGVPGAEAEGHIARFCSGSVPWLSTSLWWWLSPPGWMVTAG